MEEILSLYPEGFFDQLVYGQCNSFEISLVNYCAIGSGYANTITRGNGTVNVICLVAPEDGSVELLRSTLPHELTHIIDFRIGYYQDWESDILNCYEEKWAELNPEGFRYGHDDEELCLSMYDKYFTYFADSYGCATPLEDRATLFADLMGYYQKPLGEFYLPPERCAKYEFWCRCCRDAFDTSTWPEQTEWERQLEICKKAIE